MTDVTNALRRWWHEEGPRIKAELSKAYRVGSLDENVVRMLAAATGEAFRAGWQAREVAEAAEGKQRGLFDEGG